MRAFLTLGSLLIVLAIIALSVRSQLQANKRFLPTAAASGAASMPLNGTPQQVMSQYQRDLEAAVKADAQHTADQAASAADQAR
jgi:septal ring-binding cell division protein DamX